MTPLTIVQEDILKLIAANRSPESHFAGGTLINATGIRYSADLDLFHDAAELTLRNFDADSAVLSKNGYRVTPLLQPRPGYVRAMIVAPGGSAPGWTGLTRAPTGSSPWRGMRGSGGGCTGSTR